jgi:hypothetical protein
MNKASTFAKQFIEFYKEHYISASSTIFFVFTALCYAYCDNYFSKFDIDFFIFGGFTDVYQVALSNRVLGLLLFIPLMTLGIILAASTHQKEDNKIAVILKNTLYGVALLFVHWMSFNYIFGSGPARAAEVLKSGFSARYHLHSENEQIRCQAIIGSTKEYIAAWDYDTSKSRMLLRSTITKLELAVGTPPAKHPISTKFHTANENDYELLRLEQAKWSRNLLTECNHKADWKTR